MCAGASIDAMFQGWTNPCVAPPPPALPDLTALCEGAARLAAPPPLSRDALQGAWSLPQVDRKFIPIVCDGILAIVDQHAAHERVRLEELREEVCFAFAVDSGHVWRVQIHATMLSRAMLEISVEGGFAACANNIIPHLCVLSLLHASMSYTLNTREDLTGNSTCVLQLVRTCVPCSSHPRLNGCTYAFIKT